MMEKELQIVVPQNALEVFQCEKVDEIIERIEKEARSIAPDTSTDKGRKSIASIARKVSSSKVALDKLGKNLVSEWKEKAKLVDNERKMIRDRLDALRDEIRQPLTDFEAAEKARAIAKLEAAKLAEDHEQALIENDLFDRQREIERREAEQARLEKERADKLARELEERRAKELAEKQEAERKEREERIAKEAAERAQREAEEKIRAAEEAAKQAERDKIAADERRKLEAKQAKIDAENAKIAAKEAAELARQNEIDRQEEEKRLEAEKKARAEANKAHVAKINRAAAADIHEIINNGGDGVDVVKAIALGRIHFVTINY